jgi:hypothetical protein
VTRRHARSCAYNATRGRHGRDRNTGPVLAVPAPAQHGKGTMRRLIGLLTATTLTTLGVVTATAAPASASAPAPVCTSGGSRFTCLAQSGTAPDTWTVSVRASGTVSTYTVVTPSTTLRAGCTPNTTLTVVYSFGSGGVSQTSAPATFTCLAGPPV